MCTQWATARPCRSLFSNSLSSVAGSSCFTSTATSVYAGVAARAAASAADDTSGYVLLNAGASANASRQYAVCRCNRSPLNHVRCHAA